MNSKRIAFLYVSLLCWISNSYGNNSYKVPDVHVEVLKPHGLMVSIPDERGIQQFRLNGNLTTGQKASIGINISGEVNSKSPSGLWEYKNENIVVHEGDVLYYSVFVLNDNLGYQRKDEMYVITKSNFMDKTPASTTILPLIHTTKSHRRKPVNIRPSTTTPQSTKKKSKYLILGGRIPNITTDGTQQFVDFILWEKLNLNNFHAKSSTKNADGTITFEMKTLQLKRDVLEAAEKILTYSTIYIIDADNEDI